MSELRIQELELQLVTASASIATLTATNAELTRDLSDAELRNKKLRRNARNGENSLREQLALAQRRH